VRLSLFFRITSVDQVLEPSFLLAKPLTASFKFVFYPNPKLTGLRRCQVLTSLTMHPNPTLTGLRRCQVLTCQTICLAILSQHDKPPTLFLVLLKAPEERNLGRKKSPPTLAAQSGFPKKFKSTLRRRKRMFKGPIRHSVCFWKHTCSSKQIVNAKLHLVG